MVMEDEAISFSEEGRRFSDESSRRTPLGSPTEAAANKNMLNAAIVNSHLKGIPEAPRSTNAFRLPVKMSDVKKAGITPPRLLHPFLHNVPMNVRFGIYGFLSNVLFMIAYNTAVVRFDGLATSSAIYSIVYLIFIPVSHLLLSLLVFGWPERYLPSLLSNAPVGLTAIALGAALTAYLDQIEFNKLVVRYKYKYWNWLGYVVESSPDESKGEFYSSLFVLLITGVWTFILSIIINSPSEPSDKKEL